MWRAVARYWVKIAVLYHALSCEKGRKGPPAAYDRAGHIVGPVVHSQLVIIYQSSSVRSDFCIKGVQRLQEL